MDGGEETDSKYKDLIKVAGPVEIPWKKNKFKGVSQQERIIWNFITHKSYCCLCNKKYTITIAQLAAAVEYTDCTSAEG